MAKFKEIDKNRFELLCKCMCTEKDIADEFLVNVDTLCDWCKRNYEGKTFSEACIELRAFGTNSLRSKQFVEAMKGNNSMLIWLGKQYLSQSDNARVEHSGNIAFSLADQIKQAADKVDK